MKMIHTFAVLGAALTASAVSAQTARGTSDTVAAYGARLLNPADPNAKLNQRRVNNRINNRLDTRISNRIERYRVGAVADPGAAFARTNASPTDAYGETQADQQRGMATTSPQQPQAASSASAEQDGIGGK